MKTSRKKEKGILIMYLIIMIDTMEGLTLRVPSLIIQNYITATRCWYSIFDMYVQV